MNKGVYLLVLFLKRDIKIKVGKLGEHLFKKGYYIYVGSAMNSLTDRVKRHLKKEKKYHWHIDYLLDYAKILFVILIPFKDKIECKIAKKLKGKILVRKFGSTDCSCESHLFYYESLKDVMHDITNIMMTLPSSDYDETDGN